MQWMGERCDMGDRKIYIRSKSQIDQIQKIKASLATMCVLGLRNQHAEESKPNDNDLDKIVRARRIGTKPGYSGHYHHNMMASYRGNERRVAAVERKSRPAAASASRSEWLSCCAVCRRPADC